MGRAFGRARAGLFQLLLVPLLAGMLAGGCGSKSGLAGGPTLLVNDAGLFAIDAANIYWAGGSGVNKMPKSGGATTALVAGRSVSGVLVANGVVFAVNITGSSALLSVPAEGGTPTVLASRPLGAYDTPRRAAVSATDAFLVITKSAPSLDVDSAIYQIPLAAPSPRLLTTVSETSGLATDGSRVFWTEAGSVWSIRVADGTRALLASGQSGPTAIVVDATNVFWTNEGSPGNGSPLSVPGNGSVMSVPKEGTLAQPTVMISGRPSPVAIAIDDANVYWAEDAAIMRMPKSGGTAVSLASATTVLSLYVDDTRVYWLQRVPEDVGMIYAAPK